LIEPLVVIAVIALLLTLLMPSLNQARALARAAVCLSHKRSISAAVALYASEHDGTVPSAPSWQWIGADRYQRPWYWFHLPENYGTLGDRMVAKCPEDPWEDMSLSRGFCGAYAPQLPNDKWVQSDERCFEEIYPMPGWGNDAGKNGKLTLLHSDQAPHPAELLFIACTLTDWPDGTLMGANKFGQHHPGQQQAVWLAHPGGAGGLFVDGHAGTLDEWDLLECCNGGLLDDPDDHGILDYYDREGNASWR
jgi:prepilin-type processing-associated H-X9-DG protein